MTLQAGGKTTPDLVIDTRVQPFPGAGDGSAPNGAAVNRPDASGQNYPGYPSNAPGAPGDAGPATKAVNTGSMGPQV